MESVGPENQGIVRRWGYKFLLLHFNDFDVRNTLESKPLEWEADEGWTR